MVFGALLTLLEIRGRREGCLSNVDRQNGARRTAMRRAAFKKALGSHWPTATIYGISNSEHALRQQSAPTDVLLSRSRSS